MVYGMVRLRELKRFRFAFRATYNGMEDLLVATDKDLSGKILALTAGIHCLDTHKRFAMGDAVPFRTETARNVQLTKVENEVPQH